MGQKFSIDIQNDNGDDPVVAGTPLRGSVVLTVKKRLKPTDVMLHFIGTESTYFPPTRSKGSLQDEKVMARAVAKLRDAAGEKIRPGVYTLPFHFALPSSLPSSFQEGGGPFGSQSLAKISYCLQVEFGHYKAHQKFLVQAAPLKNDVVPCLVEPVTHNLKTMGMLNKGFLSVGASAENTRIGKGNVLRIALASRNEASIALSRVRVKLVELVTYQVKSKEVVDKINLCKIDDLNLPGLQKRTELPKADVRRSIRKGVEPDKEATYQYIYDALLSRDNHLEIVVPPTAKDSYSGNIIEVSHYVKITFFTGALVENPFIKIPIVIGHKDRDEELVMPQSPGHISTVIAEDDSSDTDTTIEVGSRASFVPMADAVLLGREIGPSAPEEVPLYNPIQLSADSVLPSHPDKHLFPPVPMPTAPTESMIYANSSDEESVESDLARYTSSSPQAQSPESDRGGGMGYAPYQMYSGSPQRPQPSSRLGPPTPQSRGPESARLEVLLRELNGSIQDYGVFTTRMREAEYRELFRQLTPTEFRCIIGHVNMSSQVKVANLLAKHMAQHKTFTSEHCAAALEPTSGFFRPNMVETLLPYCRDLAANHLLIQNELSDWESVITERFFEEA
eukprot:Nitzschia sp. Nitz4//scaffold334_size18717//5982//7915//NITZ4_008761-RA/size18717-augustus-gene-0.2-mRNA-1//-1//CDS//3329548248//2302//frame0